MQRRLIKFEPFLTIYLSQFFMCSLMIQFDKSLFKIFPGLRLRTDRTHFVGLLFPFRKETTLFRS